MNLQALRRHLSCLGNGFDFFGVHHQTANGNIDFAGLVSKMSSSGELGTILSSWLGDGANAAISPQSIQSLLGEGAVQDFASQVGTDSTTAAAGLAEAIPQLMDKASSGGNLLESLGGAGGLLGAASSLFK